MDPELLLFILYMAVLGAGIGTFTGLVPGIHVNTLAALMLASYAALEDFLSAFIPDPEVAVCVSACIVSAAIVHSFVDYVPSVFIGAPDPDDVISMLPGHRLLSEGRGMAAVRSAAIGSCVGAAASIAIAMPMQSLLMNGLGDYFDSITAAVLCIVILIMILRERDAVSALWAAALMLISGMLGLACMDLDIPCTGVLSGGTLLFPLLTGLFGMPSMISSLKSAKTVPQTDDERYPIGPLPGIKGVITGALTGWFPGITSTAGAVISSVFTPEERPEGFIAMTASIGTSASIMMLVTLSITGHGRSGTMIAVSEILGDSVTGPMNENFLLLLLAAAIASALGYCLTIGCGKVMASFSSVIETSKLSMFCIALILSLTFIMTGPWGLAVLAISTFVGYLPQYAGTGRVYLTGCLLVPTLLTHLSVRDAVLAILCI